MVETPKQRRGFAAMSPERRREIAVKGGRAAQVKGTAHRWTPETAIEAGKRGAAARSRTKNSPETKA